VKIRARLLLWCAVAGVMPLSAMCQENDVVYLNANPDERKACVIGILDTTNNPPCPATTNGYLVQGRRAQFRVVNRKFFTDYSINIDGVTQLKQIAIQDLEEAATLQTPISSTVSAAPKGAAPKGLSTAGQLSLRSAQDLLAELVDQGRASNPASELESDAIIVEREGRRVEADRIALNQIWDVINGAAGSTRTCQESLGAPNLSSALSCLDQLYVDETTKDWPLHQLLFGDEDKFRALTVEIGDSITRVKALSISLQQNGAAMSTQLSALDGDLAQWKADLNTLHGNVWAAQDAIKAYQGLTQGGTNDSVLRSLRRAQIKLKLMQDLNGGAAGAKPTLDDAELNRLVDVYSHQNGSGSSVTNAQVIALHAEIESIAARQMVSPPEGGGVLQYYIDHFLDIAREQTSAARAALEDSQRRLGVELPTKIDRINARQSQVLARANEIYDHSEVPEALDKVIDLSKNSGNLHVYFTVRRVDVFPRYNVPAIPTQGAAAPVVPVSPPVTPAPPTGATPQDLSPGIVVAHGSFDVHDFYRATVVAAFTFSTIKNVTVKSKSITSGQAVDGTPCTAATPCSQPFLDKGTAIPSVAVGVNYYLSNLGHDTFPGAHNSIRQKLGIFGGLSTDRLNSYFVGLAYEPSAAVQFTGGLNFVSQDAISGTFSANQAYTGTPSFGGRSAWAHGAYFGAGFNLSIFRKIFGSVTGLGTKASGAGN
jgi:hypothetical protein